MVKKKHSDTQFSAKTEHDLKRQLNKEIGNSGISTSSKLDCVPNIRLFLLGQVYALGVATALDVGDAIVAPAVLIVTDQKPVVIRRQRRLPGTCREKTNKKKLPKSASMAKTFRKNTYSVSVSDADGAG